MDADVIQQQSVEWIVGEEEDWSGVNDCGAIFVPDREMRFDVDDDEWPRQGIC